MSRAFQKPLPDPDAIELASDPLTAWAKTRRRRVAEDAVQGLRFAFYWRVSTEDHQDPVTSRQWQLDRAVLLRCTVCDRVFEGHWVHGTAGYRCRHGHTSAKDPGVLRPKNVYLREDRVLAKLPLLHHRLTSPDQPPSAVGSTTTSSGASASAAKPTPPTPHEVITHLRERALELRYDPEARTIEAGVEHRVRVTI